MINNFKYNKGTLHKFLAQRHEADWMNKYRFETLNKFEKYPWPTTKDEEWRRTNISYLDLEKYSVLNGFVKNANTKSTDDLKIFSGRIKFEGLKCVEAKVVEALNKKGIIFTTISDAALQFPELVQKYFVNRCDGKFQTLNQSFWTHGIFLYVPESVEILEPFLAVFDETTTSGVSFPHLIIVLERGAKVNFQQEIKSKGKKEIFRNAVTNITVSEAASLNYIETQQLNHKSLNFSNSKASVARDANLNSLIVNLGSHLTKTNFESELKESGADVKLRGLYYANRHQHFDLRTVQNHLAPKTTSHLLYKGVVKDRAHGIYQGLIKVHEEAHKTDAYQSNKNLVLNDKARADSIPSLEIEANDVKCSHGSTVGKVNEAEIFYLMSRGIPYEEARKMIISGFLEDVLENAPKNIRAKLQLEIEQRN